MILSEHPRIELICGDCMDFMATRKDKQFSLAIVDPPYGIDITTQFKKGWTTTGIKQTDADWDLSIPTGAYFNELFRVSTNQIIWGGNYFIDYLHNTRSFVVWDKMNGTNAFADCELAWTSFDKNTFMFRMHHFSAGYNAKIHPTQKPVKLYEWLLTNYAKPGDTILDTHGGSFSSAIAAYRLGFDFTGIELDADYFNAAVKRFKEQTAQMTLFTNVISKPESTQLTIDTNDLQNSHK